MSKKFLGIVGVLALVAAVLVFFTIKENSNRSKSIVIGAVLPLTGSLASYGQNARDGIALFAEQINKQGGIRGVPLRVQFEDTAGQPAQAVSALKKLLTIDKVIAVIGGVSSSTTLAMAPVANQNKVVLLSPAASAPAITTAGPYIYRVWPSDVFESTRMAQYVLKKGIKRIAIFYVNNDYGQAMANSFRSVLGGKTSDIIVSENKFGSNTTDVRTQLSRIRSSSAEWIYLISYPKDTAIILRQMTELGLKVKILATSSYEDPLVLAAPAQTIEGSIFTSPVPPSSNNIVEKFRVAYKKKYAKEPGLVADYGYDSLLVLTEAIRLGGATREGIASGMSKLPAIQGATGVIKFDKNGDVLKPAGMKTINNGKYVWLEK